MTPIATAMTAPLRSLRPVSAAILLTGQQPTAGPAADPSRRTPRGWLDRRHAARPGTRGARRALVARPGPPGPRADGGIRLPARPRHGVGPRPGPDRRRSRARQRAAA